MSIWCTRAEIGWTEEGWVDGDGNPVPQNCIGGEVRSYATGFSNHYPTTDDTMERRASIDTADIPPWCIPGYESDETTSTPLGEWLRLSVRTSEHNFKSPTHIVGTIYASVVMNQDAVRALRDELNTWLEQPKAYTSQLTHVEKE